MEHRRLGNSGLLVSVVGLGCSNFGGRAGLDPSRAAIHKALDLGITLFDTADNYANGGGSESCLGAVLGARRKDIVLATKFASPTELGRTRFDASRRYIMTAIEASLRRLRTDWIDLYQLHRPDPLTPIEETLRALEDLVRHGKVRYIGCSNLPAWRVVEAHWTARMAGTRAFISAQDEYNVLARGIEGELLPALQACGMGLLPYYPLASGLLTGRYQRGAPPAAGTRLSIASFARHHLSERNFAVVEALQAFCRERGRTLVELAFGWLAARPAVASVIAGVSGPEQVEQNVRAFGWRLSADELAEIDEIAPPGGAVPA